MSFLYFLLGMVCCSAYNQPKIIHDLARDNFRLVPYFANPIKKKHLLMQLKRIDVYYCRQLLVVNHLFYIY